MDSARPLGRRPPSDDRHLQRYSLTPATLPTTPTPVVLGINWYDGFDEPAQRTERNHDVFYLPHDNLGSIRGGHAICVKPPRLTDTAPWWQFYDQGNRSSCVGFSISRMMTLLNRRRYDGYTLYRNALLVDEYPGEDDTGTSVRAGCDVARDQGLWRSAITWIRGPFPEDGISENRWATSVEQIAECLDPNSVGLRVLNAGYVTLLNSWGAGYPHLVRLPLETLARLLREDGEATLVVDKP